LVRTDKGTEFKNKTLAKFFDEVGITQQFSAARTPQQNGVVERRNRTLVEAARTMLAFANLPSFLWAEAIATACFTQNQSAAFRIYNKRTCKIHESVNVNFDEISGMASKQFSLEPDLSKLNETGKSSNRSVSKVNEASKNDLEDLFQDFYDEYSDSSKIMKSSTTNVETSIIEEVFHKAIILEMTLSSTLKASGNSLICRCGPLVVVVVVVVIVVGVSSSAYTILGYMASPLAVGAFGTTWSIIVEVAFRA
nr:putative ribonuclease H-like domain-containing protein [Tanacetum cinerariifolium]